MGEGEEKFPKNPCTERKILLVKAWACHMALASSGDSDTHLASSCKLLTGIKFRDYWECLK